MARQHRSRHDGPVIRMAQGLPAVDPLVAAPGATYLARRGAMVVSALAVWTPQDELLGAVAPLALGMQRRRALVIDLDPGGPHYRGRTSLAGLVAEGPRSEDLQPSRRGLAVLRNGGVAAAQAAPVVQALIAGWGDVVLRLPGCGPANCDWAPVVPVRLAVPGDLLGSWSGPAVWQPVGWRAELRDGVNLPRPRPRSWAAVLAGRRPAGDPWVRAWRPAWERSWE